MLMLLIYIVLLILGGRLWIFDNGHFAEGSDDETRLMADVFKGYNSLIQPVKHLNDTPLIVRIALQLVLLINVVGSSKRCLNS